MPESKLHLVDHSVDTWLLIESAEAEKRVVPPPLVESETQIADHNLRIELRLAPRSPESVHMFVDSWKTSKRHHRMAFTWSLATREPKLASVFRAALTTMWQVGRHVDLNELKVKLYWEEIDRSVVLKPSMDYSSFPLEDEEGLESVRLNVGDFELVLDRGDDRPGSAEATFSGPAPELPALVPSVVGMVKKTGGDEALLGMSDSALESSLRKSIEVFYRPPSPGNTWLAASN